MQKALADALWDMEKQAQTKPNADNLHYVPDGGALLYNDYHGQNVKPFTTIVFDGYENGPAIKDVTHCRPTGSSKGPTIIFAGKSSKDKQK